MDFGRNLVRIYEAFCAFFGRILGEAFQVEELALMIRATRGRSMDGWKDGWMDGWIDRPMDGWMDRWMDG